MFKKRISGNSYLGIFLINTFEIFQVGRFKQVTLLDSNLIGQVSLYLFEHI